LGSAALNVKIKKTFKGRGKLPWKVEKNGEGAQNAKRNCGSYEI